VTHFDVIPFVSFIVLVFQQQNGHEKVLEFKHPFFQRDNPELLGQIRKIVNGSDMSRATCENSDIIALKSDVEELKVHLYMLSNKLVMLSNSVTQLLELKGSSLPASNDTDGTVNEEPSPKKRKTSSDMGLLLGGVEIAHASLNIPMPASLAAAAASSSSSAPSGSRNKEKE
jgi:hypothetical protein